MHQILESSGLSLTKGCKRLVTRSCCRTMPEWASIPCWSQTHNAPGVSDSPREQGRTRLPLCVCLAGRKETEASAMRFSNSYDILDVCFANLCFAFKLRWDTTELRLREATPPLIADSSRGISVKLINSCYFMLLHLLNISSQDSPVWLARSAIWTKSTSFAAHTQLSLYCHDECRIRCAWREKISIWLQYDNNPFLLILTPPPVFVST